MSDFELFIDFDFTITTDDVGNRFYTYFSDGKNEPWVEKWLKHEISSYTCLTEEAKLCGGSKTEYISYIDKFEIDTGFNELYKYCNDVGLSMTLLSDGLDFYIKQIMYKYGYKEIPFYANKAILGEQGLQIELPYWTEKCPDCGNCKGERIRVLKKEKTQVIYIGDGFSDLCAIKEANFIFAKDDLAKYCRENSINYIYYTGLSEVVDKLKEILQHSKSMERYKVKG